MKSKILCAAIAATFIVSPLAMAKEDFGQKIEKDLAKDSDKLFGFKDPLKSPATAANVIDRAIADADERIVLAKGLQARFVARNVAYNGDMIAFWPDDINYTHLIVCIEGGRAGTTPLGNSGNNAGVQRINVSTGQVDTILHGTSRCDGIRTTPWGTILATEESDDGRAYEILDPLTTTDHWIASRATGDIRNSVDGLAASTKVIQRLALPTMAWEGLTVLPNGVVIGGDELRPGTGSGDKDGGAIFRFVPTVPFVCDGELDTEGAVCDNAITNLANSPLTAGATYAMQAQCSDGIQFGQGCEIGLSYWLEVDPLTARADANANHATGYYRPEDLHRDPTYGAEDLADLSEGIRFCWTNTGSSSIYNFAETLCAYDLYPEASASVEFTAGGVSNDYLCHNCADPDAKDALASTVVNRFVEGDMRFNSHDNLAFQPVTGNVYVVEDDSFGEIYACLPDGDDRDIKSDGCAVMLSVADLSAEPTGFTFDGTGKVAYLIVQHGQSDVLQDFVSNPVDGKTDDLIRISGFKVPKAK